MRGDRKKQRESDKEACSEQGADDKVIEIRRYRPKRIPQLLWRACIKKVWEVDPLSCPKCSGEMKIVSFIYQPRVIRKIREQLNLYCPAEAASSPGGRQERQRASPLENKGIREVESMPYDDGWPGYEEPVF